MCSSDLVSLSVFFFFNDTATTEIYTLSLHDALPILAMDEFGMWLKLRNDEIARWSFDGFTLTIGLFFLLFTLKPGINMVKRLWTSKKTDRKSTRLNSSHTDISRMPSSA